MKGWEEHTFISVLSFKTEFMCFLCENLLKSSACRFLFIEQDVESEPANLTSLTLLAFGTPLTGGPLLASLLAS